MRLNQARLTKTKPRHHATQTHCNTLLCSNLVVPALAASEQSSLTILALAPPFQLRQPAPPPNSAQEGEREKHTHTEREREREKERERERERKRERENKRERERERKKGRESKVRVKLSEDPALKRGREKRSVDGAT